MNLEFARAAVEAAKAIQEDVNEVGRPPAETSPSWSHSVINPVLVSRTRGYIEKVVHQVNKSYDGSSYDACAVMLRRLLETLIIEAFEAWKIGDKIKDQSGGLLHFGDLITKLLAETSWTLGQSAKKSLPKLRKLGNDSAHSRRFTAMRQDIDSIKDDLRVVIQELVYLAKLK